MSGSGILACVSSILLLCVVAIGPLPAYGQSVASQSRPIVPVVRPVARFASVKPPAINTLVACRHNALLAAQGAQMKAGAVKKHIGSLTPPREMLSERHLRNVFGMAEEDGDVPGAQWQLVERTLILEDDLNWNGFKAVAFTSPSVAPAEAAFKRLNLKPCMLWHSRNPELAWQDDGVVNLSKGEILVSAVRDLKVRLAEATVSLKPGSVVLVGRSPSATRIVSLMDTRKDGVVVAVCQKTVALRPGRECMIAASDSVVKMCRRWDGCGRRHHRLLCGEGHPLSIALCDVSIPSLLKSHNLLRQAYLSPERHERKLVSNLVKMAACLAHCNQSKARYEWAQ